MTINCAPSIRISAIQFIVIFYSLVVQLTNTIIKEYYFCFNRVTPMTQLRSVSSASWNTNVPKRHRNLTSAIRRGDPPNHQVKTPFKQAVNKKPAQQVGIWFYL